MSNEIISEIRLELDKFRADLKQAEKEGGDSGKKAGKGFGDGIEDGMNKAFSGVTGKILAIAGAIGGAFAFKEMIHAATEQENAINRLNSSMAVAGTFTQDASKHALDYAASLQRVTTTADEVITQGQSMLVTLGHLSGQGLDRATKASLDLAAGLGIDTTTAFNLVSKAASGHASALGRYGISVKNTGDDVKDFGNALFQLETRFKGLAELQANTFSGALAKTKNAFGEILESLGNVIIKSPTVIRTLQMLAEQFFKIADSIAEFAKNKDIIGDFAKSFLSISLVLTQNVGPAIELFFNFVKNGFMAIKTGVLAIAGLFNSDLAAKAQESFQSLSENSTKMFDFDATAATESFLGKMTTFVNNVKPVVASNFKGIADAARLAMQPSFDSGGEALVQGWRMAFSKVALNSESFKAQLQNKTTQAMASFRDGIGNSFAAIGAALAKGEDAFVAFRNAIWGVFGDLAMQIGQFYFLMGLANLFLNPPAAAAQIAGGLALIALGGALKAFSGGGGASTGGGVASGGGAGSPPIGDRGAVFQEQQNQEPQTKIDLIVQGNVMDRRETGLALVDVLNEAFGSNGLVTQGGS